MNEPDFAWVASLAGEPARAAMLSVLFDGRAMPAGELARAAGIAAATASVHLNKLVAGGLVRVRAQGRHRYYELANPEIAHALEAFGSIAPAQKVRSLSGSMRARRLRFARSCYNHLAGELALILANGLVRLGALEREDDGFRVREAAREILAPFGIDAQTLLRTGAHVRACIDWTERRHHIAGPLGTALLESLFASGALRRRPEPRALEITQYGREMLFHLLAVDLSSNEILAG